MRKNKLINLIFYFNEEELLEKRLSYYQNVVDKFIVIDLKEYNVNSVELLKTNVVKDIVNNIPDLNFEDVIWCSKVGEIIPINEINRLNTYSDYEVFNHQILNWMDNLSCNRKTTGSYIFTYSSLLRNKSLFADIYYHISFAHRFINNNTIGYTLIGFQDLSLSESLKFHFNINLTTSEILYRKTNMLSVDNYKNVEVLNNISSKLGGYFNNSFEFRPPITINVDILPDGLIIDNQIYKIELPKHYPFGGIEDFVKNELLKYLKLKLLLDYDLVDIKNKTENKSSVLKYIDFLNSIPSEIT